jgi:hypothetical protein
MRQTLVLEARSRESRRTSGAITLIGAAAYAVHTALDIFS